MLFCFASVLLSCTQPRKKEAKSAFSKQAILDFERVPLQFYTTHSLGIKIPLPALQTWQIRESNFNQQLIASHRESATTLQVSRFDETSLVSVSECLTHAKQAKIFPNQLEADKYVMLSNEQTSHSDTLESQHFVMLESYSSKGHIFLIMSRQRTCWIAHAKIEATPSLLGEQLEFFSSQVLAHIQILKMNTSRTHPSNLNNERLFK